MKDLSELRNILIEKRFITIHAKGISYYISPTRRNEFNKWKEENIDLWNSFVSEWESEDEFLYFLLRPTLKKEMFLCMNCGKQLTFSHIKRKAVFCSEMCRRTPKIPEGYLTVSQLVEKFKDYTESSAGLNNILERLNLAESKLKVGKFVAYGPEVIEKLSQFYKEHPDPKRYFTEKTCLEKYGCKSTFESPEIRKKSKETLVERYGCENYYNKEAFEKTCLERYGVRNVFQNEEIKERSKKTMMEKYGVEYTTQSPELQKKIKTSNIERFGVECPFLREDVVEKRIESCKRVYEEKRKLRKKIISESPTSESLAEKFGVVRATINNLANNELNIPHVKSVQGIYIYDDSSEEILRNYFERNKYHSKQETEIYDFIKSIYDGEVLINDRKMLKGNELDIYIPEKKIAIEADGVWWHCEVNKPKTYHLDKTKRCEEMGIRLIHVYESDWRDKKDICKSILSSAIGVYSKRYFARKLKVKVIADDESELFFKKNHLQSANRNSNVTIGLVDGDEIIQACSFIFKSFHSGEVELTRMATKLNCKVSGGFSRIINHFVKRYKVNHFVSYINRAWFTGKGYYDVGFKFVHYNPISYYVVFHETLFHKSYFRKNRLKQMFYNGLLSYYNDDETEEEIEHKNKLNRFYDCGTIKVEYFADKEIINGCSDDGRTGREIA